MAGNKIKVKKKLNIKKLIIFILIIYLIVSLVKTMVSTPIKNIIIKGNYYVSDNEIITSANLKNYPAISTINVNKIKNKLKENKLITDVSIKRTLKFQVIITVNEQKIICLDKGNNVLMLANGEKIDNNNEYLGIPTLINYTKDDVLKKFLEEMGKLDYEIIESISEIEYSPSKNEKEEIVDETRFLLKMNDGNLVYINNSKLSSLKYYQKIVASLNDKKGILHLDSGSYLEEVK